MSIIAIKNRKLAWDSQVTGGGGMKWGSIVDKVRRYRFGNKSYYAGGCGSLSNIQHFYRYLDNMESDDFAGWLESPKYNPGNSSSVFIYMPEEDQLYEFADRGLPVLLCLTKNNYAAGVGSEYAYGAMDSGKSAYDAVKMVTQRFDSCSPPIHKAEWRKRK